MKEPLFAIGHLSKRFSNGAQAINDLTLSIHSGETLALIGESGCGKTTLGRLLLRLDEPSAGQILFKGREDLFSMSRKRLKSFRKQTQYIFQDPYSSLNPRMSVENILKEPFEIHGLLDPLQRKKRAQELLVQVGLSASYLQRFPHELSGGQRQRIGIARAISLHPEFIVCDEPLSALDVSVRAQIVNLLRKLQGDLGLSYLLIAHDLPLVKYLSHRVAVMYLGHLVELAPTDSLYSHPKHPYTQALISSIPIPDPKRAKEAKRILLLGDPPSPLHPPPGCPFSTRCPYVKEKCRTEKPVLQEKSPTHFVACHEIDSASRTVSSPYLSLEAKKITMKNRNFLR